MSAKGGRQEAEGKSSGRPASPTAHPSSAIPRADGRIEVAAAVIQREDGCFLLGQRPAGKPYAGYWEFPGGKIERGEQPLAALARELHEELGIGIGRAYPWLTRDFDYAHAAVRLRFFRVLGWSGSPRGRENQRFSWQSPGTITVDPVLPANGPILRALQLPSVYAITRASAIGERDFLRRLQIALDGGLRLVQVREKHLPGDELRRFAVEVVRMAHARGARVLVNGNIALARDAGADGVHLTSAQLGQMQRRPDVDWVGASCHDAGELARAAALGADFAVLGPVLPTPSHPGATCLGWDRFGSLLRDCPLPVFALGGMRYADLEAAWARGAHGIGVMRAAWA
jgi:8-oxo-dGTP diphosphatase